MNTTVPEGVELAKAVVAAAKNLPANVELVVAPPFTHLVPVGEALKGSKVKLSAQNCADHEKGALAVNIPSLVTASAVSIMGRQMKSLL